MEVLTVKLRDGRTVLAKKTKYGVLPVTYANYTQANKKARELAAAGFDVFVPGYHRPMFVVFTRDAEPEPDHAALVKLAHNFGTLKPGEKFRFDHSRMSQARAANRPACDCVKQGPSLVRGLGWYKRCDSNTPYYCDTSDPVVRL